MKDLTALINHFRCGWAYHSDIQSDTLEFLEDLALVESNNSREIMEEMISYAPDEGTLDDIIDILASTKGENKPELIEAIDRAIYLLECKSTELNEIAPSMRDLIT